ncbi:class I glutamine amidotransferase-like protein [Meira miltonrushii]|uniref:Class I glutamine amidotransferase-like protein n=1 Tax=Meira miltonrushii TaxID=1280837 RepID=A0A316V706_9BASI|nr:class I glutamine amidotransferase-like protein [Meira miltonrushii]PWN32788.1 class I glutamine amidotransferase-like protein [Meira miltonrushii]
MRRVGLPKSLRLISLLTILAITLIITADIISAEQRVLIYTKTAGFRHASIPNGIKAFEKLGKQHGIHMFNTENEKHFEDEDWVNGWDAMVFLSVSGTMLNDKGAVNMMKYIENGGGYMGVHEACDAMYKSPWYGRLVGAYFDYHPYIQHFTLDVETHDHPSTSFLNKTWEVYDEVYTFNSNPRDLGKKVVLTADSKSFKDPTGPGLSILRKTEGVHPIAWYAEGGLLDEPKHNPGGGVMDTSKTPKNQRGSGGPGRSFYTGLGHTHACWEEKNMVDHVWGGLKWVLDSPTIRSNNATLPASAPGTKFVVHTPSSSASTSNASQTAASTSMKICCSWQ